jgi:hypothetical protein
MSAISSLRKRGVTFIDLHYISSVLGLPLTRLGDYAIELADIFDELDSQTKRNLHVAMKSLEKLFKKCHSGAILKLFG